MFGRTAIRCGSSAEVSGQVVTSNPANTREYCDTIRSAMWAMGR